MNKFADLLTGLGLLLGLVGTVVAAYCSTPEVATQFLKTGVAGILIGEFVRFVPRFVAIKEQ